MYEWKGQLLNARLDAGRGLLIGGDVGTGKSSLAALICREAAELGRSVRWVYLPTLLDEMAESKSRKRFVDQQAARSLLVWDDLATARLADWEIGWMERVVEKRYSFRRSMIITTNMDPLLIRAEPAMARIVDRWRQANGKALYLTGKSRRRPEQ